MFGYRDLIRKHPGRLPVGEPCLFAGRRVEFHHPGKNTLTQRIQVIHIRLINQSRRRSHFSFPFYFYFYFYFYFGADFFGT